MRYTLVKHCVMNNDFCYLGWHSHFVTFDREIWDVRVNFTLHRKDLYL